MTKSRTGSVEYGVCILASALFILIIGAFAVPLAAAFSPLFVKMKGVSHFRWLLPFYMELIKITNFYPNF